MNPLPGGDLRQKPQDRLTKAASVATGVADVGGRALVEKTERLR
jgi:hypothetical protein